MKFAYFVIAPVVTSSFLATEFPIRLYYIFIKIFATKLGATQVASGNILNLKN